MTVFGFNDKENAQTLNRLASNIRGKTNAGQQRNGEDALIVQVPAGETLDARVGADVGTLHCEIQQLGTDATLSDSGRTCLVYNKGLTAFQAGEYIDVVRQKSLWIAIAGGGGTAVKMFKSTSTISANGSGTAVEYIYTDGSGWADGVDSFDIINPWSDEVSSAKKLTAYEDASGKWVMIQAECEDA